MVCGIVRTHQQLLNQTRECAIKSNLLANLRTAQKKNTHHRRKRLVQKRLDFGVISKTPKRLIINRNLKVLLKFDVN